MVIDQTGVKVSVKLSDSRSNLSQDICLPHFVTNDGAGVCASSHKGRFPEKPITLSINYVYPDVTIVESAKIVRATAVKLGNIIGPVAYIAHLPPRKLYHMLLAQTALPVCEILSVLDGRFNAF